MATLAETTAIVAAGQLEFGAMNPGPVVAHTYSLPALPYAYDALEPHISSEIMTLHHDKHHQAYVANLNAALTNLSVATAQGNIADQIALQPMLRFNGGGHINHALFWPTLAPAASEDASNPKGKAPKLVAAVTATYGGLDEFTAAFSKALLGIQGSGWGWLVKSPSTESIKIVTTKDQDPVVVETPIIGIDMWEHAYYLQYKNGKQSYVDNVWKIINWTTAEARFTGSREEAFDYIKVTLSS